MMRIFRLNSPEWFYIMVGSISAVMMGATFPVFAIIFGEFYGVSFYIKYSDIFGSNRKKLFL